MGQQKHFKYDCFRQLISSSVAADKSAPPLSGRMHGWFEASLVIKNASEQANTSSLTFSATEV